jgi:hypothetical protein
MSNSDVFKKNITIMISKIGLFLLCFFASSIVNAQSLESISKKILKKNNFEKASRKFTKLKNNLAKQTKAINKNPVTYYWLLGTFAEWRSKTDSIRHVGLSENSLTHYAASMVMLEKGISPTDERLLSKIHSWSKKYHSKTSLEYLYADSLEHLQIPRNAFLNNQTFVIDYRDSVSYLADSLSQVKLDLESKIRKSKMLTKNLDSLIRFDLNVHMEGNPFSKKSIDAMKLVFDADDIRVVDKKEIRVSRKERVTLSRRDYKEAPSFKVSLYEQLDSSQVFIITKLLMDALNSKKEFIDTLISSTSFSIRSEETSNSSWSEKWRYCDATSDSINYSLISLMDEISVLGNEIPLPICIERDNSKKTQTTIQFIFPKYQEILEKVLDINMKELAPMKINIINIEVELEYIQKRLLSLDEVLEQVSFEKNIP